MRGVLIIALAVASCGHPKRAPSPITGDSMATAIPIAMETTSPDTLAGDAGQELPARSLPRFYLIALPSDRKADLKVSLSFTGPPNSVSVDALGPTGSVIGTATPETVPGRAAFGYRSITLHPASGTVYLRVSGTGAAKDYGLSVQLVARPVLPVEWPKCDPNSIDPANPTCAGVVACEPMRPDFKNPSCCAIRCTTDRKCASKLARDTGAIPGFVWIELGSRQGINKLYRGTVQGLGTDGKRVSSEFFVSAIEVDRTMIGIADHTKFNLARIEEGDATILPPLQCGRP